MTILIEDIATYLATQLHLTVGTNVFVSHLPPAPDTALAVLDAGGETAPFTGVEHRRIQVIVRDTSYSAGAQAAGAVLSALNNKTGFISGRSISFSVAAALPIYLGMEEGGLHSYSLNFLITVKP